MSLRQSLRRLSVYGDMWTRFMESTLRGCPVWLESPLLAGWTLLFMVAIPNQRRAVAANLRAIHPDWGRWRALTGTYRVMWNFGYSIADAIRANAGEDIIDWDIDGLERFKELAASEGGVIVLTAHTGNYDLAAPVFAQRFGRRLNAVRAPERQPELQAHFEKRRADEEGDAFAVRYNADGAMLGVELASLLGQGELVALQGDRVLFEVAPAEGQMFGSIARIPMGPFALAMASRAPVWPLFILRDGWRRYRIRVGERFEVVGKRGEREQAMAAAIRTWCSELEAVLRRWWYQWFVFEQAFGEPVDDSTATATDAPSEDAEPEAAVRGVQRGSGPRTSALAISFSLAAVGAAFWLANAALGTAPALLLALPLAWLGTHLFGFVGIALATPLDPGKRGAFNAVWVSLGLLAITALGFARGEPAAWTALPWLGVVAVEIVLRMLKKKP